MILFKRDIHTVVAYPDIYVRVSHPQFVTGDLTKTITLVLHMPGYIVSLESRLRNVQPWKMTVYNTNALRTNE